MSDNLKLTPEQQKLVEDNINLIYGVIVDKFGFLYNLSKEDFQDVEQAGKLALCDAARQYNPEKSKFSTFAYMVIRQDLQEFVTKNSIISEEEGFANDLEKSSNEEKDFARPADFSAYFVDDKSDAFSDGMRLDVEGAFESFFSDKTVTKAQKRCVKAFLYSVVYGYGRGEAAILAGAKTVCPRNDVLKGREILKNRKEFKALWESSNLKSLAS